MKTTTLSRPFPLLSLLATALLLSACGGGGGSNPGTDPTPTITIPDGTSPETYMAFYGADNLWMIKPDDPLNELSVDNSIQSPFNSNDEAPPVPVFGGDWNSTDQVVENPRISHVVYGDTTVNLFRVATDLEGNPMGAEGPVRMSNASPTVVCGLEVAPGYGNPLEGIVAFLTPDGGCDPETDTGEWRVTRLSTASGDPAASLGGEPVAPVLGDDGNPLGYLIYDDAATVLKRVDLNSSGDNVTDNEVLAYPVNNGAWAAGALPGGPGAIFADGELYVYERQSDDSNRFESSTPSYTLQDATGGTDGVQVPREHTFDAETLFFIDDGALHRVDLASGSYSEIARPGNVDDSTLAIGSQLYRVVVTPDHLAWFYPTGQNSTQLVVYNRNDLTATPVVDEDLGNVQRGLNPPILRRTGGWLFYSRIDPSDGRPVAVARKADDSSTETFDDAQWLGGSSNQVAADLTNSFEVAHMAQGVTGIGSMAGASIKSVPGNAPGSGTVDHGELPLDVISAQLMPLGMGSNRLLQVTANQSDPRQDVYFFDSTASGSLDRVDPDPKDNDRSPVLFF